MDRLKYKFAVEVVTEILEEQWACDCGHVLIIAAVARVGRARIVFQDSSLQHRGSHVYAGIVKGIFGNIRAPHKERGHGIPVTPCFSWYAQEDSNL